MTQNCLFFLADYRKLLQTQEVRSVTGQTEGAPAKGDDEGVFCPPTQGDTCPQVSTADADENDVELCDYHDAHDTRDENETVDVLPLDSLLDTANPSDTKVSWLINSELIKHCPVLFILLNRTKAAIS